MYKVSNLVTQWQTSSPGAAHDNYCACAQPVAGGPLLISWHLGRGCPPGVFLGSLSMHFRKLCKWHPLGFPWMSVDSLTFCKRHSSGFPGILSTPLHFARDLPSNFFWFLKCVFAFCNYLFGFQLTPFVLQGSPLRICLEFCGLAPVSHKVSIEICYGRGVSKACLKNQACLTVSNRV